MKSENLAMGSRHPHYLSNHGRLHSLSSESDTDEDGGQSIKERYPHLFRKKEKVQNRRAKKKKEAWKSRHSPERDFVFSGIDPETSINSDSASSVGLEIYPTVDEYGRFYGPDPHRSWMPDVAPVLSCPFPSEENGLSTFAFQFGNRGEIMLAANHSAPGSAFMENVFAVNSRIIGTISGEGEACDHAIRVLLRHLRFIIRHEEESVLVTALFMVDLLRQISAECESLYLVVLIAGWDENKKCGELYRVDSKGVVMNGHKFATGSQSAYAYVALDVGLLIRGNKRRATRSGLEPANFFPYAEKYADWSVWAADETGWWASRTVYRVASKALDERCYFASVYNIGPNGCKTLRDDIHVIEDAVQGPGMTSLS
ncbi:OLC1v1036397C1 [Oldenlandia corymbosa var. corymbosa]|uniref:OLC1v1036397C1 n=1 Tax=Oldenlandia corymbosa var. corymbosa TaxID=529605 RepID=A0AAV1CX60_OLDCO|nr:OLC1v1036397C1 [Oldenlandia corymbosa var. corymbosa]